MFVAVLLVFLAGCGNQQKAASFIATDITGAEFARDFALKDHLGHERSVAHYYGKIVVIFFGFTHCPDVCPTTLAEMAKAMKRLEPEISERIQVLFVTVDPARDKPALLTTYVSAFHPSFVGLWGDEAAIAKTAKEYKIAVMKNAETKPGIYSVDHSTQSFVYDTKGRVRLFIPHAKIGEAFAHDIRVLLDRG